MRIVNAVAAFAPDQPLRRTTIERRDVGPTEVLIEIAYCGVCHSDIHCARSEWGSVTYPIVVGHEIAGHVVEVGADVTRYAVGDRVGVGCMVDSCRDCDNCKAGLQQYCTGGGMIGTYDAIGRDGLPTAGGYSTHIVVEQDYVLRIPDALGLDVAAPLLCAGITLYSPLRHWNAGPGTQVAIVGLGGLGHMGVQLAHAMGAQVAVLSQSLRKQDDGLRLGADAYYATSDPATFEALRGRFDLIVNTVSADLDLNAYLSLLAVDGTLVQVGAPVDDQRVHPFSLIPTRRSLAGSMIGGIQETQEMLDFCAEHGFGAQVEVVAADQVNEAWDKVVNGDVRYRYVIDVTTLA